MEKWVQNEYRTRHCDQDGHLVGKVNLDTLRSALTKIRPNDAHAINDILKRLHIEICADICRNFEFNKQGEFKDTPAVHQRLLQARSDLKDGVVRRKAIIELQERHKAGRVVQTSTTSTVEMPQPSQSKGKANATPTTTQIPAGDNSLKIWIHSQYLEKGFRGSDFIGWKHLANALAQANPGRAEEIKTTLKELRQPGYSFSLKDPDEISHARAAKLKQEGGVKLPSAAQQISNAVTAAEKKSTGQIQSRIFSNNATAPGMLQPDVVNQAKLLGTQKPLGHNSTRKFNPIESQTRTLAISNEVRILNNSSLFMQKAEHVEKQSSNISTVDLDSDVSTDDESTQELHPDIGEPDFDLIDQLITKRPNISDVAQAANTVERDIGHAPLLAASIVTQYSKNLVPQYGFLGSGNSREKGTKVFQNTNVPFSTFICGVQGSGKSHTTACMLENALIASPHLGRLQAPVSALVFSYSEFSSGGSGFSVSEAAHLAAANETVAAHRVKKVTVLTSPSNLAIKKFYRAIPGVEVIPFKLKAKTMDIGTLLTLMAVNEKSEVPLYMAKVESILRAIATESEDGRFDYDLFKQKLALENFDSKQTNVLDMRLGLLESFLDKEGNAPVPKYRPGEVTIIDLSDPFVSSNTACILFKLGLERFMQSRAPGKMVVLDEAHKYMLNTPGPKVLTDYLTTLIRLQRHKGARVVISTQEPTVSFDLIALCSVTVVHRFTSPAWYAALKKHINAMNNEKDIMRQIEGLETGEAMVYAPNAVLDMAEDGSLVKATGRLLRLNIRKRITRDGGESIMAV